MRSKGPRSITGWNVAHQNAPLLRIIHRHKMPRGGMIVAGDNVFEYAANFGCSFCREQNCTKLAYAVRTHQPMVVCVKDQLCDEAEELSSSADGPQ